MKICVTSQGENLDSEVDSRFGRSHYFIIVDSENLDFESIKNPNIEAVGGAGIQSAQLIANKGAKVLLTGHCGPNGFHTLQAAGVEVIVGASGTVKEAIEKYKKGELKATDSPDVMSEFGMPKKSYEL
ncbi:MAG TPA: NifB/NifX family molybdenum-iron cluster-binding protein [Nitrospinota bacterium]|nr:NifB/NifX family molybdenum-iron cluster-binding protein [Nitrospinota bacterium]